MNVAACPLGVRWLGRVEFAHALVLQEEIVTRKRNDASLEDQLLLLEHEPVYTIGRTPDQSSLSGPGSRPTRDGELGAAHLPHPLFAINRGGQATYHGPGQLMGYPIIAGAAMICINICAGSSSCSLKYWPRTALPRRDANRSRAFG